jgi:hypothetical protein
MKNNAAGLADYVDQRLFINGMFDKFSYNCVGIREWKVALLQDVYAEIEGKQLDLGHAWVQHAEPLKKIDLGPGDWVRCNCRVTPYTKRLRVPNRDGLMIEPRYSLCYPTNVEVLGRALPVGRGNLAPIAGRCTRSSASGPRGPGEATEPDTHCSGTSGSCRRRGRLGWPAGPRDGPSWLILRCPTASAGKEVPCPNGHPQEFRRTR